jgi:hypothetical protein
MVPQLTSALSMASVQVPLQNKVVPALLSALITLSSGSSMVDAFYPAPARADVEEVDEDVSAKLLTTI